MSGRDDHLDEGPQAEDLERFGHATVKCPKCGAEVYDEAEWCHKCGAVLSASEETGSSTPKWVMITAISLALGFILIVIVRAL
ncbi:MAG: zinc ribbon domain-containing protein, partial [Planctomycetota bacterium]|nr:zinc ribbon domain-containing protein [Planctomycetota bacterium]